MEAVIHPVLLIGFAFISALIVLGVVFVIGQWVGRKKWHRIKRSSMGDTVTVDMGQQETEE